MAKKITSGQVKKGIVYSVGAQVVSLGVSILLNLFVPKFIGEIDYANWQTYMLYVGYVGILHFGLLDGLMLRYSQYDYDELDKPRIRSQFIVLLVCLSFFCLILALIGMSRRNCVSKIVFVMVGIATISRNVYTYTSYTFQMTNRIKEYASLVIVQRALYALGIISLLLLRIEGFLWFCVVDVCADIFANFFGMLKNKGLYLGTGITTIFALKEAWINVSAGIILLAANWSSMLLVGGAKMVVQWHWSTLTFGKVSFAFSISNLFLTFVSAISIVLFPSLKRMDKDSLPNMYCSIRDSISPLLFCAMLLYFPGAYVLSIWLPKYQESLVYLGVLLPIIVFSSKVSLLTNNYLKTYRKEKRMLIINIASVLLAFVLYFISAYIFNNLTSVMVMVVLAIMLRSIFSEIMVEKLIGKNFTREFIVELIMTIGFIISAKMFNLITGMIIYFVMLCVYLYFKKDIIHKLMHSVLK